MLTKDDAMSLPHGAILHHVSELGSDGEPVRCRVTGKCKTWVTQPERFKLPVKHGLYNSFYITEHNAEAWEWPT